MLHVAWILRVSFAKQLTVEIDVILIDFIAVKNMSIVLNPLVKWAQDRNLVHLTIEICDAAVNSLEIEERGLKFQGMINTWVLYMCTHYLFWCRFEPKTREIRF